LEIIATSGGSAPFQENVSLRIAVSGQSTFTRYVPSAVGEPPIEENSFILTGVELEQIWQAIQDNDFFNINGEHSNPDIEDRTFAHLIVRANGNTHEVTTQNIAVPAFDNIMAVINGVTPPGNELKYDVSGPAAFEPRDVCDIAGITATSAVTRGITKGDFLSVLRRGQYSGRESLSGASLESSTTETHAGTTVGYRISLQEAVSRGIVTLEGKGGFYGDQISIAVDNSAKETSNKLAVTLYLEFWGPTANTANVQKIKDAVEGVWSGKATSDGKAVTVSVETRLDTTATSPPGTAGYHQIKLEATVISNVVGRGSSFDVNRGVGSGTWATSGVQLDKTYAHEAGHLLGLGDRYQDYRKQSDGSWRRRSDGQTFTSGELANEIAPKYPGKTVAEIRTWLERQGTTRVTPPDDPNDLMSSLDGQVRQSDIDAIGSQAGLVVEVRPGDIVVNKDGNEQNFAITRTVDMFVPAGESKTLPGLHVACLDAHEGVPSIGGRFDLAPSLDTWVGSDAAPLLLNLVRYVDRQELFCPFDFTTQLAVWRISDNEFIGLPDVENLLQNAGINVGNQVLDFPRLSDPNENDPDTGFVVPPEVSVGPGHYLGYPVTPKDPVLRFNPPIGLRDQFHTEQVAQVKAEKLFIPASKNGGPIFDAAIHLKRYKLLGKQPVLVKNLEVNNQFGQIVITKLKADSLLVPTAKSLTGPPPPPDPATLNVDHYKCYKVIQSTQNPPTRGLKPHVNDQFLDTDVKILKPTRLCNPVDKEHPPGTFSGIKNPTAHLMCYQLKPVTLANKVAVDLNNQFRPEHKTVVKANELCVPSTKIVH
jgi:hypothetical protein